MSSDSLQHELRHYATKPVLIKGVKFYYLNVNMW